MPSPTAFDRSDPNRTPQRVMNGRTCGGYGFFLLGLAAELRATVQILVDRYVLLDLEIQMMTCTCNHLLGGSFYVFF